MSDDAFEEAKRQQEYNRLEEEKKKKEAERKKLFKRIFVSKKENEKRISFGGFLGIIWIIAIIVLKINDNWFGDVLLIGFIVCLAIALIIEIIKKGITAIPYILGMFLGLIGYAIISLVKFIIGLFKKKNKNIENKNIEQGE
ncbi:hypothetical protein E4O04_09685 [Treponema sp. OMZ 799]|uniref:hypothetical protein n=1 Tax=Treponema sp. OMZ 799 TaxID=2563668 RepID=UPI0020A53A7D|nr:hypothetical protein [Treponema sp. OMZ 799]UTC77075.1 hypothetical protein E4O04_03255 [Treponema sp. OMZ 799]UTC78260.1 hypothetical protein E4O04_09685 [Treponema sp. OMZ 799]